MRCACEIQVSALSTGQPIRAIPVDICNRVIAQGEQMAWDDGDLQLEWDAHLRLLESEKSDFRI